LRLFPTALDYAKKPVDTNAPGWRLHALGGDRKGFFAVTVNGIWRLIFRFDGKDAELVNYLDYHQEPMMSRMHNPAHPGEVLKEFLPEGLSVTEAARRLGVTRQALSALLNGRAGMSAEMALRLEAALGTSAEMWLEMQVGYDLWQARQQRRPKVESIAA